MTQPLVRAYVDELRRAARDLPRGRRSELVQEIEEYLAEAIPPDASEAEVRTALDRLGDPEQIVAEERGRAGVQTGRAGWVEWVAVFLLPIGGVVVPVLGWVIGAVLLWASRIWTVRDKLIGTLLLPGGLIAAAAMFFLVGSTETCGGGVVRVDPKTGSSTTISAGSCTGGGTTAGHVLTWVLFAVLVLVPIATAIYLARRAQRPVAEPI
jgi:HAAS domain-containing protein